MNLINRQINICARWLQEEEVAQTLYSKRWARAEYERELKVLQHLRKVQKKGDSLKLSGS